jgi:hypothetical protein
LTGESLIDVRLQATVRALELNRHVCSPGIAAGRKRPR